VAVYKGPVRLIREEMDVKSRDLTAWLNESKKEANESTLNHAFADGDVEIFQTAGDRTRRSHSEHAEFYVAEDKVILNGEGIAQVVDSVKGTTRGKQLTYYSRNDTIQVEGATTQPAVSRIRRN
jgi:lipopolysaccharide export system protein LptA